LETQEEVMTDKMSTDRVKFYIPSSYWYQMEPNGRRTHNREASKVVALLHDAFGITEKEFLALTSGVWTGITIICRPSQFARFLIYRNERGIPNGFKELQPKLIGGEDSEDVYTLLAKRAGLSREDAKKAAYALGYGANDRDALWNRLTNILEGQGRVLEVWNRPRTK
jgi:hypothetical protein